MKKGDVLGIDVGMKYKGFYTDMAATFGVGKIDKKAKKLISTTIEALRIGLKKIKSDVKALACSGSLDEDLRNKYLQENISGILMKPFSNNKLLSMINELIDS